MSARPRTGSPRTTNRRDFAIAPPAQTILDIATKAARVTHAIGKIGDIFSHRGIAHLHKGKSDADLGEHLIRLGREAPEGSLTFANFVEFDSLYGHRRDVAGYAAALERFDAGIAAILPRLREGDMLVLTADHGNDPSWTGTDHTRERVPVLVAGQGPGQLGLIPFIGVAHMAARHLDIDWDAS